MLPGPGSTNPAALHAEPADDAANSGMAMVLMLAIAMIRMTLMESGRKEGMTLFFILRLTTVVVD